jgi:hypothetical protein
MTGTGTIGDISADGHVDEPYAPDAQPEILQ